MTSIRSPLCGVFALLALVACESPVEGRDHVYDGPNLVEFAPAMPAGNYTRQVGVPATALDPVSSTVRVHFLSAAAPESDVSGDLVVITGSTAVEGEHYRFPGGQSWTVAAGTVYTDVSFQLLPAGLEAGQTVSLILGLQDGTNYQASPNHKQFTIVFAKAND